MRLPWALGIVVVVHCITGRCVRLGNILIWKHKLWDVIKRNNALRWYSSEGGCGQQEGTFVRVRANRCREMPRIRAASD